MLRCCPDATRLRLTWITCDVQSFTFADGVVLPPEGRVVVWTGKMAKKHEAEPDNYIWSHAAILDRVVSVILTAPTGDQYTGEARGYRLSARVDILRDCVVIRNGATRQQALKKWSIQGPSADLVRMMRTDCVACTECMSIAVAVVSIAGVHVP